MLVSQAHHHPNDPFVCDGKFKYIRSGCPSSDKRNAKEKCEHALCYRLFCRAHRTYNPLCAALGRRSRCKAHGTSKTTCIPSNWRETAPWPFHHVATVKVNYAETRAPWFLSNWVSRQISTTQKGV